MTQFKLLNVVHFPSSLEFKAKVYLTLTILTYISLSKA